MTLKIHNLDRYPHTLPGGVGHDDDRAVVIDDDRTEPNILTGKPQPLTVYRGTLKGAHAFIRTAK